MATGGLGRSVLIIPLVSPPARNHNLPHCYKKLHKNLRISNILPAVRK
jgi:hypothetical protein